jgi:hypothetical protein
MEKILGLRWMLSKMRRRLKKLMRNLRRRREFVFLNLRGNIVILIFRFIIRLPPERRKKMMTMTNDTLKFSYKTHSY